MLKSLQKRFKYVNIFMLKDFVLFFIIIAKFSVKINTFAGVMELADVVDSKSTGSDTVPVRVRPPAPSL